MKQTISIIGSGNVGSALAQRLYQCGHQIKQIYSRELDKAEQLALLVGAEACNRLDAIRPTADVYLLAVRDDAILQVAAQLQVGTAIVAHTSGATPLSIFEGLQANYGVFYPLQTFSAQIQPDFEELPLCLSANNAECLQNLKALAYSISPNVHCINEAQRQSLHVAAVFVNNFTNHLFAVAAQLCAQEQLDFDMLKPLIRQTLRKVEIAAPQAVQTGPAARGDAGTIALHSDWLQAHAPAYKALYQLLTQSILEARKG